VVVLAPVIKARLALASRYMRVVCVRVVGGGGGVYVWGGRGGRGTEWAKGRKEVVQRLQKAREVVASRYMRVVCVCLCGVERGGGHRRNGVGWRVGG
jgi:hypothetical protein